MALAVNPGMLWMVTERSLRARRCLQRHCIIKMKELVDDGTARRRDLHERMLHPLGGMMAL